MMKFNVVDHRKRTESLLQGKAVDEKNGNFYGIIIYIRIRKIVIWECDKYEWKT